MNKKMLAVAGLVIVVALVAVVAVSAGRQKDNNKTESNTSDNSSSSMNMSSDSGGSSAATSTSSATNSVSIKDFAFSPASITVKAGTTVTWTNNDSAAHTVTADSASSNAPDSGNIANGQTYSFTFTKAGTYAYHCALHPSMRGTVTVTE